MTLQPPTIYNLHGEHDDRIQEWAINERIVKVIKRAVVVEVVNKPIEKIVQHHDTLNSVKQEQKMHWMFLSRDNASCLVSTRTRCFKPLPFILRSVEINDFRNSEVMDDTMSM